MSTGVDVRRRLPLDLTWVAGLGLALLTWSYVGERRLGVDAHAYWGAWRGEMYGAPPDTLDAYLYSPAFAHALWPVSWLPWPVFGTVWALAAAAAFWHLFSPLGWRWAAPLTLCCVPEILTGNVFWLYALVAAHGLRLPALWAVPALTKVTPAIGVLWFAVRREWRPLGVAACSTILVAGLSLLLAPELWAQWWELVSGHASAGASGVGSDLVPGLGLRLPLALAVIVWTASTDRRWGLPASMVLATPVFGVAALTVLAAIPRLERAARSADGVPAARTGG